MVIRNAHTRDYFLPAQGRILEEFVDNETILSGTLESLGNQFGLTPEDLRICLCELVQAGWLHVEAHAFGPLTIRLDLGTDTSTLGPVAPDSSSNSA